MKTQSPLSTVSHRLIKTFTRFKFFILLAAVLALPFISAASAAYSGRGSRTNDATAASAATAVKSKRVAVPKTKSLVAAAPAPALLPQITPESVTIYEGPCGTGTVKDQFTIGQAATLCARLSSAPVGLRATQVLRRLSVVNPSGYIVASANVFSSTQDLTISIPATATSAFGEDVVDNRGTWRVVSNYPATGAVKAEAEFTVTDTQAVADLSLAEGSDTSDVAPGTNVDFNVYLINYGPNAAANVEVSAPAIADATLVGAEQTAGADAFNCTTNGGAVSCTIASLPARTKTVFRLTYTVSGAAASGAAIVHTSNVTTDTFQHSTRDDAASGVVYINPAAVTQPCVLTCPADVIATANATVGSQFGAFVTYGSASVSGDCGSVSNSPVSGSFFPAGTTAVTSTSKDEHGATLASCTFNVKVLDTPAPTISCPADKTATDTDSNGSEGVTVGTPTYTASGGGTIAGVRSDSTQDEPLALTDPYPVGVTVITWTVTDADGRTASCRQKITVVTNTCGSDTEPPTITAPPDVTVGTGAGNTGCTVTLDDELGQPDANDNCVVTVTVTGAPAGNNFAPGHYTLTYTATDGAGNTASDTQEVTVVDDTAPIIVAPADATYTCMSEVPAANANQARGPVLGSDGQFVRDGSGNLVFSGPPFENCGTVNVTVSETNNGGAGSAANPRIITRTYTATDSAGNSASAVQTITVSDPTPPSIALVGASTVTVECHTSFTDPGATASDNCGTANVSVAGAVDVNTVGSYTLTYTATDAAGNTASVQRAVNVVDTTLPVVSLNGASTVEVFLHGTYTELGATASDSCAGPLPVSITGSVNTNAIGTYVLTYSATDPAGNTGTATRTVYVIYNFTGFFSPIANVPTINQVNAGRSVPIKFSLAGNQGLNIFAASSPFTAQVVCGTTSPITDVQETGTAGSSSLAYDTSSGQYIYTWKTDSSWVGQCRILNVKFNDGKTYTAYFKFK